MTTFPEREQAFEAKFAHDQEFRFLLTVRRDKLFAAWAAERLQLAEPARASLVAAVVALRDGAGHDDLLLEFMGETFAAHRHLASRAEFAAALDRCDAEARRQSMARPFDDAAPGGNTG